VDRRLAWLAGIAVIWGAAIYSRSSRCRWFITRSTRSWRRSGRWWRWRSGATGHDLRPDRPAVGDERADGVGFDRPAAGARPGVASELLALVLHLDRTALYGKMKWAHDSHHGFLWVKRNIATRKRRTCAICAWSGFTSKTRASGTTQRDAGGARSGSVDSKREQRGNRAGAGWELRGRPGEARMLTDVKRRGIDSQPASEMKPGTPITLTIDERLQFVASAR